MSFFTFLLITTDQAHLISDLPIFIGFLGDLELRFGLDLGMESGLRLVNFYIYFSCKTHIYYLHIQKRKKVPSLRNVQTHPS